MEQHDREPGPVSVERRLHPRLAGPLPVQYLEIGGAALAQDATLRDLSLGGAGLLAHRPLPEGTRLLVGLDLPGAVEPLVVSAQVLRCAADAAGYVVGVRFLWLGFDQRQRLAVLRRHLEAVGLDAGPTP